MYGYFMYFPLVLIPNSNGKGITETSTPSTSSKQPRFTNNASINRKICALEAGFSCPLNKNRY